MVTYTYDVWGNPLSCTGSMADTLGAINPLRYRGYVYDQETGLYYLQSRYYDPEIGRFINADSLVSTGQGFIGNNMFAYCLNSPIMYIDIKGHSAVLPPSISGGLNLPPDGGWPVYIDGVLYFYAVQYSNGELFEYWFDSNGDLVHARHHSTHNKPHKHTNPHDHKGKKDENGNNTLVKGPLPVDEKFKSPKHIKYSEPSKSPYLNQEILSNVTEAVAGAAAGVAIYATLKWIIAAIFAIPSNGGSIGIALLTP